MTKRFWLGVTIGAMFVLATGLWAPAGAAIVDYAIDSPDNGEVVGNRTYVIKSHAESDSPNGLQYMRLEIYDSQNSGGIVWCAPGPVSQGCPSWTSGQTPSYSGSYSWSVGSLRNGDYTIKLLVKENGGSPLDAVHNVRLNVPPLTPDWVSTSPTTANGKPAVVLKWRANSEADMISYKITRSASNGTGTKYFKIDAASPGQQGCSLSGGTYSCTDDEFGSTGYAGTYTYFLAGTRSSPVSASGVSSGQASRSASLSAPRPSSSSGGGSGTGGSGTGGSGTGGSGTGGSGFLSNGGQPPPIPTLTASPDPFAADPREFYEGTFGKELPYQPRTSLTQTQVRGTKQRAAGFAEEAADIVDPRKMLLPVAGGLFTIVAAMHFRRVLKDH